MQYYDSESKIWKSLASTTPQVTIKAKKFLFSELVGNKLYVGVPSGGTEYLPKCFISCYDTEKNVWENVPDSPEWIGDLCTVGNYMYVISPLFGSSSVRERYNFAKRRWQRYAELRIPKSENYGNWFYSSGATVLKAKMYVLYGSKSPSNSDWCMRPAVLLSFDPVKNKWEQKASTCESHFFSTLFVVNSRIYVGGGYKGISHRTDGPCGSRASVEVYNEENNS